MVLSLWVTAVLFVQPNLELISHCFVFIFLKGFDSCIFREGKGETEKEKNINVWWPLMRPLLENWPATQACALTGNSIGDPLVRRPALNPLSRTSQGLILFLI